MKFRFMGTVKHDIEAATFKEAKEMFEVAEEREFKFEKLVRSAISGEFDGLRFGGGGLEFDHLRPKEPDDSPRAINRKASFRYGEKIVNVRIPERELEVVLVVDSTDSTKFGSTVCSKKEYMFSFMENFLL